jgi:dihydrofolate reductase
MIISLIVAMDESRAIGMKGRIPWHLPDDLKRFKTLTMGHHIIMGRKTFESIGKPLPGRIMVVITRQQRFQAEDCHVVHSINEAIELAKDREETETFIIGGGEVFEQSLDLADRIYLTIVHTHVQATTFFPELDQNMWTEIECNYHPADQKHLFPFTFKTLIKKNQTRTNSIDKIQ